MRKSNEQNQENTDTSPLAEEILDIVMAGKDTIRRREIVEILNRFGIELTSLEKKYPDADRENSVRLMLNKEITNQLDGMDRHSDTLATELTIHKNHHRKAGNKRGRTQTIIRDGNKQAYLPFLRKEIDAHPSGYFNAETGRWVKKGFWDKEAMKKYTKDMKAKYSSRNEAYPHRIEIRTAREFRKELIQEGLLSLP